MTNNQTDETTGKVVVGTFLTLDGVMQAPGGPEEDQDGGFEQGGWSVNYWDEHMGEIMTGQFDEYDALLLGRKTYELFAAHWPHVEDDPVAEKLNSMPKYVASRSLEDVEWKNTTLLEGDLSDAVQNLKKEYSGGRISVQGSQNMIQTLLKDDLVDEFWLWTFPVVVGSGKRLFGEGTVPRGLELTTSETSSTGVQMTRYERAGEIDHGTFALEEA